MSEELSLPQVLPVRAELVDQVKDDHAADEVAELHAPVQVQEEHRVALPLLFCLHLLYVYVEEEGTNYVEEDTVNDGECDDKEAENLRDQDKAR